VQTNAGLAFFAVAAPAASDVERNRYQVANADVFDVAAGLDHFARDLVSEDEARRSCSAAAHHMLVAAADISADDLEDYSVLAFSIADRELWKVDGLDLYLAGAHVR